MELYTHIYDTNFYVDSTFEDPDEIPHEVLAKTIRKELEKLLNMTDKELSQWVNCFETYESKEGPVESAEEDTESFDRSFPELSDAAGKLMAMKAIQDADHGNKIADMLLGPFEK